MAPSRVAVRKEDSHRVGRVLVEGLPVITPFADGVPPMLDGLAVAADGTVLVQRLDGSLLAIGGER